MSAALFAGKILKMDEEDRPAWLPVQRNTLVLMLGNVFAVGLVGAMVYGVLNLTWWLPILCLFITFPVFHVLILDRIFKPGAGVVLSGLLSVIGSASLWHYW